MYLKIYNFHFLLFHSEELEDSDGISVISESEMYKNHSNHSDNDEKPILEEENQDEVEEALDLLTPPVTPNNFIDNDNDDCKEEKLIKYDSDKSSKEVEVHQENLPYASSHGAVLLIVMSLIIAILYTNISSLKKEFATTASIYEQRIARLEEENQVLKTQLNELIRQLKKSEQTINDEILMPLLAAKVDNEKLLESRFVEEEQPRQKPITKDVWMGGEKEDVIKILDKKYNSLPDYCYFTDESDLFYEYNKQNCERKKRKLERRVKKFRQKNDQKADTVDEIYSTPQDPSYDDFVHQTTSELLKSLNDEIQEIKSSRVSTSITDNDVDMPFNPNDAIIEKQFKKLVDKKKKKSNDENVVDAKVKKLQKRNFNVYDQQENVNQNQDESKKKRKKLQKQRAVEESPDDWNDRRTAAREEARKKNINEDEENWFIKRNNEREIHRLELNVNN